MAAMFEVGARLGSALHAEAFSHQLGVVRHALMPFGFAPAAGTPSGLRRPVLLERAVTRTPQLLMVSELASDFRPHPTLPDDIQTLAQALAVAEGYPLLDLRLLCQPQGWEPNSQAIAQARAQADLEINLHLAPEDLLEPQRPLAIVFDEGARRHRFARLLERHPFWYSLAVLGEFSFKHPFFGQVLCGGPCGISGAWQFTCTMGKSFVGKRQLEANFFDREIFRPLRAHRNPLVRASWRAWEWVLKQALWLPILTRRAVVALARRFPAAWFSRAHGAPRAILTRLFNHLECPKSLRNGACGAPTETGQCGELLKYGITKTCVFYYRNYRDRSGHRWAQRVMNRAARLRPAWLAQLARTPAAILAAIADRAPLSARIYPPVDTDLPGASAIVSAMAGRFEGATVFGSAHWLPPLIARSRLTLSARSPEGRRAIAAVRAKLSRRGCRVGARVQVLTQILATLEGITRISATAEPPTEESTYERVLARQVDSASTTHYHRGDNVSRYPRPH
ncbi:MAG TPA: hypothetical protein VKV28_13670 [Candidatus Binataceae bacterium]|nr:hypothetical protein [Candidatus Binataceae bacterium]